MEKNLYLDLLMKGLGNPTSLSVDSIEGLLGQIADIHNTMGKSYEYLVEVITSLIKASKKQNESAQINNKELEKEIELLKSKLRDLEEELRTARDKTLQLERNCKSKDELIQELQEKLEKANDKLVNSQKDLAYIRSFNTQKEDPVVEEIPTHKKRLEDLLTPTPTEDITTLALKRKYDEILPPSVNVVDFDEDNERSSSTTTNKKEDSNNNDDYKFKKVFKKVKRNENNKSNGHSTSTPFLSGFNVSRKSDFTGNKTNQVKFDEDDSLENLLNNFIDTREIKENNSSKSLTNKTNKKDEAHKSVEKDKAKEKEKEKEKEKSAEKPKDKAKGKAVLKKDTPLKDFLEIQNNAKTYKKNTGLAFSQQSPLKALELSDSDNLSSVPLTRNGRNANMMQKMLMGNKKRNSMEPSQTFKLSAKKDEKEKKINFVNDEDLVRTSHRSKFEREGLQGFDCDQCTKFYEFIADGIHIKSADESCNRCSRHRDKFPLPSTPEGFHKNFTLNSQEY